MEPSLTPTRYGLGDVGVSSLNTVCLVLCFRFVRTGAASRSSRDWRLSAQLNLPLADGEVIYQTLRPIWQSVQLWRYSVLLVAGNMLSRLSSPLTSPASAPTDRLSATTAKPVSQYKTLRIMRIKITCHQSCVSAIRQVQFRTHSVTKLSLRQCVAGP
jgi:hypothetical protein